jgi:hypothetical protein
MKFLTKLCNLLTKRKEEVVLNREIKTHDFSHSVWGNAVYYKVLDDGMVLDAHGFRKGIAVGDYIIIGQANNKSTRYKVDKIKYCTDPSDMWFATLSFAPRYYTLDGVQVRD